MKVICTGCGKRPDQLEEYVMAARQLSRDITASIDPDAYVRAEEGTYNSKNGHFLCTDCYLEAGCPSSPGGWIAP